MFSLRVCSMHTHKHECTACSQFRAFWWAWFLGSVGVWLRMRLSEWDDCSVWVGKNNAFPSVYTIIKMPVTALSPAGTSGSAASVRLCMCVCFTVDQLLDALLRILNLWLSLRTDLWADVKSSAAHVRFKSLIQKLWLLIVIFIFREPNCESSAGGRVVCMCVCMLVCVHLTSACICACACICSVLALLRQLQG